MFTESIAWTKEGNGNTTGRHFPYKYRTESNLVSVHI